MVLFFFSRAVKVQYTVQCQNYHDPFLAQYFGNSVFCYVQANKAIKIWI